jgi:kinesin family protein 11
MDSLESIERASKNLLSKGAKEDAPTGRTPRKRKWQYVDEWSLTANRHEILSSRKMKENVDVEPRETKDAHSKPAEQADIENIENEMPTTEAPHIMNKVENIKLVSVPLEPLVDSRRRNTTRNTRRVR